MTPPDPRDLFFRSWPLTFFAQGPVDDEPPIRFQARYRAPVLVELPINATIIRPDFVCVPCGVKTEPNEIVCSKPECQAWLTDVEDGKTA